MSEATDVVLELDESNDDIDEVIQKVALKRKQQARPKRTCAPSVKLIEQAALPSGSERCCHRVRRLRRHVSITGSQPTLKHGDMHSK